MTQKSDLAKLDILLLKSEGPVKDRDDWFLKTIMPSRKTTRKYLKKT